MKKSETITLKEDMKKTLKMPKEESVDHQLGEKMLLEDFVEDNIIFLE